MRYGIPSREHSGRCAALAGVMIVGSLMGLSGCSGSDSSSDAGPPVVAPGPGPSPPPPPATGPTTLNALHGRFLGTFWSSPDGYAAHEPGFADALVSSDGAIRLLLGGLTAEAGAIAVIEPGEGMLYVGQVDVVGRLAAGRGVILLHDCRSRDESGSCVGSWPAEIRLSPVADGVHGELRVQWLANAVAEVIPLTLSVWDDHYGLPARADSLAGQYRETAARFASDGNTVITIDAIGRVQFQSASSGCIGNGSVAPHGDGRHLVFDMELQIDGCSGELSDMNGHYTGLATASTSSAWDYDSSLRAWLSKTGDLADAMALTLWAPGI